jgi:hypothetical protein
MSHQLKFRGQRIEETYTIYKLFDGDLDRYGSVKEIQEEESRKKQKLKLPETVLSKMVEHDNRFPTWYHVEDGTYAFLTESLMRSPSTSPTVAANRVFDMPILIRSETDMCAILESILKTNIDIDHLSICCSYGMSTIDTPHKMVMLKHRENDFPFLEALKHQERLKSPVYIGNVIGGKFGDPSMAVIVTKEEMRHTRYLHGSYSQYQFSDYIPKHEIPMRVCYGVVPKTVSAITLWKDNFKIVLYQPFHSEEWSLTKDNALNGIESILTMCRYHLLR